MGADSTKDKIEKLLCLLHDEECYPQIVQLLNLVHINALEEVEAVLIDFNHKLNKGD